MAEMLKLAVLESKKHCCEEINGVIEPPDVQAAAKVGVVMAVTEHPEKKH